ncbi:MAG TPA: lysophospholipid acyltransferase family protein [Thermoanaerobaculia bacterium]
MKLVSFLASLFIRTFHATLRVRHVRVENIANTPQYILAFWHAHLLLMLHSKYRKPISVMTSRSKDGEYIARVFDWYGVGTARGSSTRGGATALRELVREAKAGKNIVFTPDGPKGPARVAKEGLVYAAQLSGLPIVPIAFAAKKKSCCAPGTGWSSRIRSRKRSSSTASRSSCRVTATSKSGGRRSSVR